MNNKPLFPPISKTSNNRRLSLVKQLGILLVIGLLLFVSVGYVLQTRLEQTQSILNDLTLNTIPAMNNATRSALKSGELMSALESLTSATTPAERRIAELEVTEKLKALEKETSKITDNQTVIMLLKTSQEETEHLNVLIDQKLDLAYKIKVNLKKIWDLKIEADQINPPTNILPLEQTYFMQWQIALLQTLSFAYKIENTERLSDLQEIHRLLELNLQNMDVVSTNLAAPLKKQVEQINTDLRCILSDPENLAEQQANYLRIIGRTRGREHFIHNMISDYSNITNQQSLVEYNNLNGKIASLAQGMTTQKIWFICGFILLSTMIIATLGLYSYAVKRLRTLTQKINLMTKGSHNLPSNRDEIDELFQAFDEFSNTINTQTRRLESLSLTDSLTNIANRRAFDQRLLVELSSDKSSRYDLSILLIDVDYFKQYNDTYGHISGDEALQKIASSLESIINKETDLLARYGGEEFVVILPNKSAKQAEEIAQQMKQVIELINIEHKTSKIADAITVSIGIVTKVKNGKTDTDTLMKNADIALYHSKAQGRNQATHIDDIN
ncbi:diguanylate cyclase (GGDEF) domain-containing protein [Marinomonas polaris DSM 16579]|uniref:diguanylate cyclase n=1 Tax=Marinomonas polaris DSM 16579 TaxID=1122206 RepID=A0A1M5E9H6_9GAMM|nr:GGDEF domain-containing protein [Marinomonas polaris]SHF75794.1 diguanylate cyclase (GGDEF) domain-containing protein [Marinomonas polaris DSM 16579]